MLDKSKIYRIYLGSGKPHRNQSPQRRFSRVKILFEDDVSFYVESLITSDTDSNGFHKRYSVKKHCFYVEEIVPKKVCIMGDLHFGSSTVCPFCTASIPLVTAVSRVAKGVAVWHLYIQANLVIIDGKVVKNRSGPSGRDAEDGDYERADLVIVDGIVICDRISGKRTYL